MDRPPARLVIAAVLGIAAVAGCNDDGARTAPPPSTAVASTASSAAADGDTGSWLFVVDARSGSAADGSMTLRDVDEHVVSFTDRPERVARRIPLANLVARWAQLGFADDPPNASLTFEQDGVERVHTMTISSPTVTGDEVTFAVAPLDDAAPMALGAPTGEAPADFGPAALFIDASGAIGDQDQGTMTVDAITQDEYTKAVAAAQQLSRSACPVADAGTACSNVSVSDASVHWSIVVETPSEGDAVEPSMVVWGADGSVDEADLQTVVDQRWISIAWTWPQIDASASGTVLLDFSMTGNGAGIYSRCTVAVPSGSYSCAPNNN